MAHAVEARHTPWLGPEVRMHACAAGAACWRHLRVCLYVRTRPPCDCMHSACTQVWDPCRPCCPCCPCCPCRPTRVVMFFLWSGRDMARMAGLSGLCRKRVISWCRASRGGAREA